MSHTLRHTLLYTPVINDAVNYLLSTGIDPTRDVVIFDVDDTLLDWKYATSTRRQWLRTHPSIERTVLEMGGGSDQWFFAPKDEVVGLYNLARGIPGLNTVILTARPYTSAASTFTNLRLVGIDDWDAIIFHPGTPVNTADDLATFKGGVRQKLAEEGVRVLMNVGDRDTDFVGGNNGFIVKID